MNSVKERLIESWLDSQTERRYQPAFIQLLVSEGWSVLHNTRHSPIEFGKDVIARDPSGVLHCFQLKGNPGSRLTKAEAQALLPQFIELLETPPSPGYRRSVQEKHVAVLVTNGEIDEEARLLLESTGGERAGKNSCPSTSYQLWTRGILIDRFLKIAGNVWPTSLEGIRRVLDLMARDGREIPDPQAVSAALAATAPAPTGKDKSAAKTSRVTALLLLAEIIKGPLYAMKNHYGLYLVTVLVSVQALRFADSPKRLAMVSQYARLSLEHCGDLIEEGKKHKFDPDVAWVQRDPFAEAEIMLERRRLMGDCAATLLLSGATEDVCDVEYARTLIETTFMTPHLWGLGAVPALIVRYWATCLSRVDLHPDLQLARHLFMLLEASMEQVAYATPPATPYYSFIDCWAYRHKLKFFANDGIFSDSFRFRTWFGRAILFILAKRNYKQTCKALWPAFSQVNHEEPSLPNSSFFDATLSNAGRTITYSFHRKEWVDLVKEAVDEREGAFLEPFEALPWLIAAYVAIVPYRAWTGVLMWLDCKLDRTWYSRDHLPSA